jgi:hypothetical protein
MIFLKICVDTEVDFDLDFDFKRIITFCVYWSSLKYLSLSELKLRS